MNILKLNGQFVRKFWLCKCAEAKRSRRNSDRGGLPAAQCYSANREG